MKCVLCQCELRFTAAWTDQQDKGPFTKRKLFQCNECRVDDLSKYREVLDDNLDLVQQEYRLGNFYVMVFPHRSSILRIDGYDLRDEIKIPRALWLNSSNIDATLDKIKLLVTFS